MAKRDTTPEIDLDTGPVHIDTKNSPTVKMVTLFTIDDDEYQIPESLRPNIAVAFLRDIAALGWDVALARAMVRVIGQGAMDALAACEAVSEDDITRIMKVVENQLFSTLGEQTGKSRKGRRK